MGNKYSEALKKYGSANQLDFYKVWFYFSLGIGLLPPLIILNIEQKYFSMMGTSFDWSLRQRSRAAAVRMSLCCTESVVGQTLGLLWEVSALTHAPRPCSLTKCRASSAFYSSFCLPPCPEVWVPVPPSNALWRGVRACQIQRWHRGEWHREQQDGAAPAPALPRARGQRLWDVWRPKRLPRGFGVTARGTNKQRKRRRAAPTPRAAGSPARCAQRFEARSSARVRAPGLLRAAGAAAAGELRGLCGARAGSGGSVAAAAEEGRRPKSCPASLTSSQPPALSDTQPRRGALSPPKAQAREALSRKIDPRNQWNTLCACVCALEEVRDFCDLAGSDQPCNSVL